MKKSISSTKLIYNSWIFNFKISKAIITPKSCLSGTLIIKYNLSLYKSSFKSNMLNNQHANNDYKNNTINKKLINNTDNNNNNIQYNSFY